MQFMRRGVVAVFAAMALILGSAGMAVGSPIRPGGAPNQCALSATQTLPEAVVEQVNQALVGHRPVNIGGGLMRLVDLDTVRQVNADWQVEAYVWFDSHYCGFSGNMDFRPSSDAAAHEEVEFPYGYPDRIHVIRHGVEDMTYTGTITVGNAIPKIVNDGTKISMTFIVDREYLDPAWMPAGTVLT